MPTSARRAPSRTIFAAASSLGESTGSFKKKKQAKKGADASFYRLSPHFFFCRNALIFSISLSASVPCTAHAISTDSPLAEGQPKQCMPISKKNFPHSGSKSRMSPISVSFVTVIVSLSFLIRFAAPPSSHIAVFSQRSRPFRSAFSKFPRFLGNFHPRPVLCLRRTVPNVCRYRRLGAFFVSFRVTVFIPVHDLIITEKKELSMILQKNLIPAQTPKSTLKFFEYFLGFQTFFKSKGRGRNVPKNFAANQKRADILFRRFFDFYVLPASSGESAPRLSSIAARLPSASGRGGSFGEHRSGQVPLSGVGQKCHNDLPSVFGTFCQFRRRPYRSARRNTHQ